jgi:hypothetical protein
MILGLFVGESFAELSVAESTGPISRRILAENTNAGTCPKHGLKSISAELA